MNSRQIKTSIIATIIGIIIGWVGKSYQISDGVQLQFNDAVRWGDIREMERLIDRGADPLVGIYMIWVNMDIHLSVMRLQHVSQKPLSFYLRGGQTQMNS